MGLVILKTFDNAIDTHILKARLEAEGIQCYIFDEHIVSMNPLYNITVGGIKLKVDEADEAQALAVLAEINNTPYTTEEDKAITCPRCDSAKLISGYRSFNSVGGVFSAIFSVLLSIFPLYYRKVFKCKECGHEFKPAKEVI